MDETRLRARVWELTAGCSCHGCRVVIPRLLREAAADDDFPWLAIGRPDWPRALRCASCGWQTDVQAQRFEWVIRGHLLRDCPERHTSEAFCRVARWNVYEGVYEVGWTDREWGHGYVNLGFVPVIRR